MYKHIHIYIHIQTCTKNVHKYTFIYINMYKICIHIFKHGQKYAFIFSNKTIYSFIQLECAQFNLMRRAIFTIICIQQYVPDNKLTIFTDNLFEIAGSKILAFNISHYWQMNCPRKQRQRYHRR